MYHEHPIKILRYSSKNIWLLVFPLLRNIRNFRIGSDYIYGWLRGAWFDIMIIGLIIIFGMIRWRFSVIELEESGIIHRNGIFFRVRTVIPYANISSITFERPLYLMPFNAVKMRCDTSSGILGTADMKLTVSRKLCGIIGDNVPDVRRSTLTNNIPKPTVMSVILFSMFFSSGLSGAVYIAAFFFKGGEIARSIISEYFRRISEGTGKVSAINLFRISDTAYGIGVFFIGAWLISFIINIQRYSRFSVSIDSRCMKLSYGAVTQRNYRIISSYINFVDLRQNLIMKLSGAITVHISCPGYGAGHRSLPVLLPVRREKNMRRELEAIGVFTGTGRDFRPKGIKNYWQYVWSAVIPAVMAFPIHHAVSEVFHGISEITLFAAIMTAVPSVWLTAVRTGAFITSGVSLYDEKIMIRCCRGTTFHTVISDRRKLVRFETEQTLFQKRRRACSVSFWLEGEKQKRFRVKGLSESDVRSISQLLEYNADESTKKKQSHA